MIETNHVIFYEGSKEEAMQGMASDLPHVMKRVLFDVRDRSFVPWHWHKAFEVFYVEEGEQEYFTPKGHWIFPAGCGGVVNSNVLHATRLPDGGRKNVQLLHMFDASFLAGAQGSRIEQKYFLPFMAAQNIELFPLYSEKPEQAEILQELAESFRLPEEEFGYELKLRNLLADIWLKIISLALTEIKGSGVTDKKSDKVKSMLAYVHEHYGEKIRMEQLASAAFLSERESFRLFRECLHVTPVEYITDYRLQMARQMLVNSNDTITYISQACGLGSSSYFARLFQKKTGCSPGQYREKWQDRTI